MPISLLCNVISHNKSDIRPQCIHFLAGTSCIDQILHYSYLCSLIVSLTVSSSAFWVCVPHPFLAFPFWEQMDSSLHDPQMKVACVQLVQSTTIPSHKRHFLKAHVDGESPIGMSLYFLNQPMKPFASRALHPRVTCDCMYILMVWS